MVSINQSTISMKTYDRHEARVKSILSPFSPRTEMHPLVLAIRKYSNSAILLSNLCAFPVQYALGTRLLVGDLDVLMLLKLG